MSGRIFPDDMTLAQARPKLEALAMEGHMCPVCTQHVRVYRRKLTSVAARAVAALYKEHGLKFGHMAQVARKHLPESATQGGYLVLSQHWGLIESEPVVRGDVGRTGFWRVTDLGEDWLAGEAQVPMYAHIFNSDLLALDGPLVTREDALGEHFDFRELMATRVPRGNARSLFDLRDYRDQAA